MRIENDIKLDFKDVLIRPKRSTLKSRSEVSLFPWPQRPAAPCRCSPNRGCFGEWLLSAPICLQVSLVRTYEFRNSKATYTGVPVMSANMDTTGTIEVARALASHGMFTCLHKFYTVDDVRALPFVVPPPCYRISLVVYLASLVTAPWNSGGVVVFPEVDWPLCWHLAVLR
jgi:GMP reductase